MTHSCRSWTGASFAASCAGPGSIGLEGKGVRTNNVVEGILLRAEHDALRLCKTPRKALAMCRWVEERKSRLELSRTAKMRSGRLQTQLAGSHQINVTRLRGRCNKRVILLPELPTLQEMFNFCEIKTTVDAEELGTGVLIYLLVCYLGAYR